MSLRVMRSGVGSLNSAFSNETRTVTLRLLVDPPVSNWFNTSIFSVPRNPRNADCESLILRNVIGDMKGILIIPIVLVHGSIIVCITDV